MVLIVLGRYVILARGAACVHRELGTMADLRTDASAENTGCGLILLQMMHSIVSVPSPANSISNSQQSLADLYQEDNTKAMPLQRHPVAERTMADVYQQTFQDEGYQRIEIHAASPAEQRISTWVAGLMLAGSASVAMFTLISGWVPPGRRRQNEPATASPSRLLKQCIDVEAVPSGTVCAVCLENVGETCKKQSGSAGPADDNIKPPDQPSLEGQPVEVPACGWCRTPCGHCFHKACLVRWFNTATTAQKRCPFCNWS